MRGSLVLMLATLSLSPKWASAQGVTQHDHATGAHGGERLGVVHFPNSGARAAQQPFLRGLALLHNFEYDDARTAFRAAEQADSGFAMAYWGEALTFAQLLWDSTTRTPHAPRWRSLARRWNSGSLAQARRASAGTERRSRRCSRSRIFPRACADTSRACVR